MPYKIRVVDGKLKAEADEKGLWYSHEEVADMLNAISTYKTELKTVRRLAKQIRELKR